MPTDSPFRLDALGRTARAEGDAYVRTLIEEVLFTSPGERPNRPSFGSGLRQLLFAPASSELATATQFMVQGALQEWLSDLVAIEAVAVESDDSTLRVEVRYVVRQSGERRVDTFERSLGRA